MGESRRALDEVLADISELISLRDLALDPERPRGDRVVAAERYSEVLHQMHLMIHDMRGVLPVTEANDAYEVALRQDPEERGVDTAQKWARANAANALRGLLDAVTHLLPLDGSEVQTRAGLDDPDDFAD